MDGLTTLYVSFSLIFSAIIWFYVNDENIYSKIIYSFFPAFYFLIKISLMNKNYLKKTLRIRKENIQFDEQLPLLIDTVKACLKAGLCLDNSLEYSASQKKWGPVMQHYVQTIVAERESGVSMSDALDNAKKKKVEGLDRRHLFIFLTSLNIGYKSGGDLIKLLEKCQSKIRGAVELKNRIRVVTAQMRFQAVVVSAAPFALGLILYVFDSQRILFFFETLVGNFLLSVIIILCGLGLFILNKMSKVYD